MKRRDFLKLTMAVGAVAFVPAAAPEPIFAEEPAYTWGVDLMEGLAEGINAYTPIMTVDTPEFYFSQDGGNTWELISDGNAEMVAYDPDFSLHLRQVPQSLTTVRLAF